MALTQMALDSLDFDATVALAETVAPHVDILEIGTPCIKHNGIKLLETLKAKFPNNLILVDLKTMDAGEYEAEPFYKAGADICTVLGASGIATIKMNGITDKVPFEYTITNNVFSMKSTLDINKWNAKAAIASLNKVCEELHKGADGISKTWDEVTLNITSTF